MRSFTARWIVGAAACLLAAGCGDGGPARDLRELVVQDSTYFEPETMQPFTGRVFRPFPGDSTRTEIEGALLDGTWHGELVVYHPSGRIRYAGSFDHGARCGPWTENVHDREPDNPLEALRSEIESLGLYPPCTPE